MVKTRYEIDPYNRLVITGRDSKTGIPLYRRVIDGRFVFDKTNTLTYRVLSPLGAPDIPRQIRLAGNWSLTKNHDLKIALETSKQGDLSDELVIAGSIISVGAYSFTCAVTTKSLDGTRTTYTLECAGTWQADAQNRLQFRIRNESGRTAGILTFTGTWDVADNTLRYRYVRRDGVRGRSIRHTITFTGRWNITGKTILTYSLDVGSNAAFRFKTGIGSFKHNRIEYEVGVGYAKRLRPRLRTIILYGTWHIDENAGLTFDIETTDGTVYTITFTAEARITENNTIRFKLKGGTARRELGGSIELAHRILKGEGEAFVRFLKSRDESAVMIGAAMRW